MGYLPFEAGPFILIVSKVESRSGQLPVVEGEVAEEAPRKRTKQMIRKLPRPVLFKSRTVTHS